MLPQRSGYDDLMLKPATPDHPIHPLLAERWSPYAFADRLIPPDDLASLFEAARWAASSFNEQPWRYIVATRDQPEEFKRLLACLRETNQAWARRAPALAIGVVKLLFTKNGKSNRVAVHDLGLASANLVLEATARGLAVHQMEGILPEKVVETYDVPEGFEVMTGIAIGYLAGPGEAPQDLLEKDAAKTRSRKPLAETVFAGRWGQAADLGR